MQGRAGTRMMIETTRRDVLEGAFDVHRLRAGPANVYRIADIDRVKWPATALFRSLAGDALAAAAARTPAGMVDLASGSILLSFNTYLIEMPGAVVLIDAGIGNDKERLDRPAWHRRRGHYLKALSAVGFAPDRVDLVVNTHLHADHVGWNTVSSARGPVPTFPRARYVTPEGELAFWRARYAERGAETLHGAFADSIQPLLDAGRLEAVAMPAELLPGLHLEAAPGHTPGMGIVRLRTAEAEILFLADVVHHPVQLSDPGLGTNFCMDPAAAAATRKAILADCAARGTIVAPYHFPAPVFGRFRRNGAGFDYVPMEMTGIQEDAGASARGEDHHPAIVAGWTVAASSAMAAPITAAEKRTIGEEKQG